MVYNYGSEIEIGKHLTKGEGLEPEELLQMDMTIQDSRNVLEWTEVDPKVWGFNEDKYRCYSTQYSGWNGKSDCYLMQLKTWAWKLEIKVKTDNFYIRHAWCYGKYIKIDKTFNSGDTIIFYMVRLMEFRGISSNDCDITAWYIPPFVDPWDIDERSIKKQEKEAIKQKYLINNQIHSSQGKYIWYQNGLSKFAVDNTLSNLLNHKKPLILIDWVEEDIFGNKTGNIFEIFSNNLPSWFDEEEKE